MFSFVLYALSGFSCCHLVLYTLSGAGAATVILKKSSRDSRTLAFATYALDEFGFPECVLQTDPEAAAHDLARAAAKLQRRIEVRTTPRVHHSQMEVWKDLSKQRRQSPGHWWLR